MKNSLISILLICACNLQTDPGTDDGGDNGGGGHNNNGPVSHPALPESAQVYSLVSIGNNAIDSNSRVSQYRFRTYFLDQIISQNHILFAFPTVGNHVVYFSAKDDGNIWGPEVSAQIRIYAPPLPPPVAVIFNDDGTLNPISLGYELSSTHNGRASTSYGGGQRYIRLSDGSGGYGYFHQVINFEPGHARLRFGITVNADVRPEQYAVSDDTGIGMLAMTFVQNNGGGQLNYIVYGRKEAAGEGVIGRPPVFEEGRGSATQVWERIPLGQKIEIVTDVTELIQSKFPSSVADPLRVNGVAFTVKALDAYGRGEEFMREIVVDYIVIEYK